MADEGKLNLQRERGDRAKRLMEDPLLQEGFANIEAALIKAWKGSAADETLRREDAWRSLKLLEKLRTGLVVAMSDGQKAGAELLRIEAERKLSRLFRR